MFQIQSGSGIGGILAKLFTKIIPIASKVGRAGIKGITKAANSSIGQTLKDTALRSASEAAINVLSGESPKEALEKGLSEAKSQVASAIREKVSKTEAKGKRKTVKRKQIKLPTEVPKKRKNYNLLTGQ